MWPLDFAYHIKEGAKGTKVSRQASLSSKHCELLVGKSKSRKCCKINQFFFILAIVEQATNLIY